MVRLPRMFGRLSLNALCGAIYDIDSVSGVVMAGTTSRIFLEIFRCAWAGCAEKRVEPCNTYVKKSLVLYHRVISAFFCAHQVSMVYCI